MTHDSDNERAALEAARAEARETGETGSGKPTSEPRSPIFWVIVVVGCLIGATVLFYLLDPCASQRVQWFVRGEGMRKCAFVASCTINDGSMPHVAKGEGYIWFDESAPPICRGVQF